MGFQAGVEAKGWGVPRETREWGVRDFYPDLRERREIRAHHRLERFCTVLVYPVPSEQRRTKVNRHLTHKGLSRTIDGCGHLHRREQVFTTIRAGQTDGQLGAR